MEQKFEKKYKKLIEAKILEKLEKLNIPAPRLINSSDKTMKISMDYLDGKKLAGILLEVSGEYSGHCQVVIGIGLNVKLSDYDAESIDQPWAQLSEHLGGVSRNVIAATMINHLIESIEQFDKRGFESFKNYWIERDAFINREVDIILPNRTQSGISKGVNSKGELLMETEGELVTVNAGELSLRLKDVPIN